MKIKGFGISLAAVLMFFFTSMFVSAQSSNTGNSAVSEQAQSTYQSQVVYTGGETVDDSNLQHRGFSAGGVSFPQPSHANYWGTITADGRFEPAKDILSFKNFWTEESSRALAEQEGGKIQFSLSGLFSKGVSPTKTIVFLLTKPQDEKMLAEFNRNYELIQTGYFYSEGKIVSSKLLGGVALQGLKSGADAVLYTEGFSLRIDAESWSIGIGTAVSAVSGGGPTSNGIGAVGGGGLGWANAWAEYYSRPWLRVKYFRKIKVAESSGEVGKSNERGTVTVVPLGETNGKALFKPEIASPPELQTGVNGNGDKEKIRKLNPGAIQQP